MCPFDLPNHLQAGHSRHVHVNQHDMNLLALDNIECFLAVTGQQRSEPSWREDRTQRLANIAIVVGDQQAWWVRDHGIGTWRLAADHTVTSAVNVQPLGFGPWADYFYQIIRFNYRQFGRFFDPPRRISGALADPS